MSSTNLPASANTDPDKLQSVDTNEIRRWFEAQQKEKGKDPGGLPASAASNESTRKAGEAAGKLQELMAVTPDMIAEFQARRQAENALRQKNSPPAGRAAPAAPAIPDETRASQRKAALEQQRAESERKSQRWRLMIFCAMLAGIVVMSYLIYWLIQTKFEGHIPFFK